MRPSLLNPLFSEVKTLSGVGDRIQQNLAQRIGGRIVDIIFHLPSGFIDRRAMPPLDNIKDGSYITAEVKIEKHLPGYKRSHRPHKVICGNETGHITLVFFNLPRDDYFEKQLPVGETRIISGKIENYDNSLQMPHPDFIVTKDRLDEVRKIQATYPLTQGISQKVLGKIIKGALRKLPDIPEWIEGSFLKKQKWDSWKNSILSCHAPQNPDDFLPIAKPRERVAYDELLANQLALALSRNITKKQKGIKIKGNGTLRNKLIPALPFRLTGGQQEVLAEILDDMASENKMLRLLQGDVGSGKTIVALLAILNAIESEKQAAIMAPTEILSSQHMTWIEGIIKAANLEKEINISQLTGSIKGKKRSDTLKGLESGKINLLVGTHALFQENVKFKNLAFIVIDEQHRFGVKQRLALSGKGEKTDILLMTATPIPRTLTMTLYGDMEISNLKEKPAGRKPIDTRVISIKRLEEVIEGLKRAIKAKERAYWVCPLIEKPENAGDEQKELAAAEERFACLKKIFGKKVGLVHGRMTREEKDKTMMEFKEGRLDILVATTVIEVGVDVPEATIMLVEHAERFGLSQLHQLRGRVGRDNRESKCILLYSENIGEMGKRRLKIIRETEDGFRIAEEDLVLRGSGELLGTKQSGMPDFKFAVLPEQSELLFAARDDVKMILNKDRELKTKRGEALRDLLYLFEYDTQIKYLRSG